MTLLRVAVALLLAVAGLGPRPAAAHETTRSYAVLEREGQRVEMRLRVAFRDIEVAAWMDEDLDGRITWGETRRRLPAVEAYLRAGLALSAGGDCALTRVGEHAARSGGIDYLDLRLRGAMPERGGAAHRALAALPRHRPRPSPVPAGVPRRGGDLRGARAADPEVELAGDTGGALGAFARYFRAGVGHLMGGADHVVFLLALMLPAVCAAGGARSATLGVLAAVTGFTIAHALTLTAATTELLRPPADLINALIALSIVITAADNLRPFIPAPRTAVAAFFGTIHGFGFAGALGALQLSGGAFAVALLGFNLGIEAAQVGVVLLTMPALYMLGSRRLTLWAGSAAAGAAGMWWLWLTSAPLALAG